MKNIELNEQEYEEFLRYKREKQELEKKQRQEEEKKIYRNIVDETVEKFFPVLQNISKNMAEEKKKIIKEFESAIELKKKIFEIESTQQSHTFTNSDGTKRITIGVYQTDAYRDTVNEGIEMVRNSIINLAKDKESKLLVEAILKLLSKDTKGNLKASRVLQLYNLAQKIGNKELMEGVRIIQESYQPITTKTYIRAEYKDTDGKWNNIPLGMTEAD
ncbi:MAG: DUF3164 family protein [Thermaurantimonas sp.]|uniref:DUF3164 family protein n=1 Tax=Thermaurantimonas aggregans TaxID=2173829 RepID=A0A401XI64_9FLAO|nr:DUF3164 family protein [Thermaurantimonas aggregans]GCD76664.1 hypothetical protein JCM31826_01460 [Thermaurantimonas aggregans]